MTDSEKLRKHFNDYWDKVNSMPKVKRQYFNIENEKTIDLLPLNDETIQKIRLERKCMEKEIEGSTMTALEVSTYLRDGFTITTYQADYVLENYDFSYDEFGKPARQLKQGE